MAAEVDLSAVMEHLAIAFGGIYEKLTERDMVVNTLSTQIVQLNDDVAALSGRAPEPVGAAGRAMKYGVVYYFGYRVKDYTTGRTSDRSVSVEKAYRYTWWLNAR